MYLRIWRYRVPASGAEEFAAMYGPDGAWARLFRTSPGYLGTRLYRSRTSPDSFSTLDRWESAPAWSRFLADSRGEYADLDRRGDQLTELETEIGAYDVPSTGSPVLDLVPFTSEQQLSLVETPGLFEELSGFAAADGLREYFVSGDVAPDYLSRLREGRGADPWFNGFAVVEIEAGLVIGTAGFAGPPGEDGKVEIAYAIVPSYQGRGYATCAAATLISFAFGDRRVTGVRAHTLEPEGASTRVLIKNGFSRLDQVVDPRDGPIWRWERRR